VQVRALLCTLVIAGAALAAAAPAAAWTLAFRPYQAYTTGAWPQEVEIADVTGDGRNDVLLMTTSYGETPNNNKLLVFAQQPDGSLAEPQRHDVFGSVAAGDLDGDGDTDVALAHHEGVKILTQSGGALSAPRLLPDTPKAGALDIADLDGDGRNDIIVSEARTIVLTNQGGGAFRYSDVGESVGADVEAGDVNGDGRLDISGVLNASLVQLVHAADGTYAKRSGSLSTYWVHGLALGDFTGDGRIDSAVSAGGNKPDARMLVVPQLGDGSISAGPQEYESYDIPEPADARDLDGDGRSDVVTVHGGWLRAGVYLQSAEGTLQPEQLFEIPYASHYSPKGLDLADVDCDGRADIVVADYNHGLVVLRQVAPESRPATCPPPERVLKGASTPPPPASSPPAGPAPGSSGPSSTTPSGTGTSPAAGTAFGGGVVTSKGLGSTSIALLQRPDGRASARVGMGLRCGKTSYVNLVVRLAGFVRDGSFTATGRTNVTRRGRLTVTLTGVIAGGGATGNVRVSTSRLGRCERGTRPFRLRAAGAPAGTPTPPAANALMGGVTSQVVGHVTLPVILHVSRTGRRVTGLWQAAMRCGPKAVLTAVNFSPPTTVRADGTFVRTEKYRIRYPGRETETYRVELRGRFLSDGATGTLRARMQTRKPGRRFFPCDSGVQSWTAGAG
jgi:hypothetical protein